jgi:hypothetical protein
VLVFLSLSLYPWFLLVSSLGKAEIISAGPLQGKVGKEEELHAG